MISDLKHSVRIIELAHDLGIIPNRALFIRCIQPGHEDKHPSCKLYPDTNRFYCFSCGANGDVIDFVSLALGISPKEAMSFIQNRYLTPNSYKSYGKFSESIKKNKLRSLEAAESLSFTDKLNLEREKIYLRCPSLKCLTAEQSDLLYETDPEFVPNLVFLGRLDGLYQSYVEGKDNSELQDMLNYFICERECAIEKAKHAPNPSTNFLKI